MVRYINEDLFDMPTPRYFIDMARSATLLSMLTVPAEDAANAYKEAAIELYVGNAPLAGKIISSPIDAPDLQYPVTVLPHGRLTLQYCVEISPIGKLEKQWHTRYPILHFGTELFVSVDAIAHAIQHGGLVRLRAPDDVAAWLYENSYHLSSVAMPMFVD